MNSPRRHKKAAGRLDARQGGAQAPRAERPSHKDTKKNPLWIQDGNVRTGLSPDGDFSENKNPPLRLGAFVVTPLFPKEFK